MKVEWIKMSVDMFDNRKIKQLRKLPDGNNIVLIWCMLLTMAGRCNAGGMIYLTENIPYTPKMLADELDFEENTIRLALEAFLRFGMIEKLDDDRLILPGWMDYQNIDGLERIKAKNRERVQKYRKNQKFLAENTKNAENTENVTDCNVTCNVTVTPCNAVDIDKDKERDIDKEKEEDNNKKNINKEKNKEGAKTSRFRPPCLEEVEDYCRERGNSVDAETFVDFYASKNWMVGKNKMSDWKAAVRTWEKRENERTVDRYKNKNNAREEVMDWLAWSEANEGSGCFDWVGGEEE